MSNQRALAKAARTFTTEILAAKTTGERAVVPAVVEKFVENMGGVEGVADALFKDFQQVRGQDLTEEEKAKWQPKDQVVQKYYTLILKFLESRDERLTDDDLAGLDEKDLQAIVLGSVREAIDSDPEFRRQIVLEAVDRDPELIDILVERSKKTFADGEPQ